MSAGFALLAVGLVHWLALPIGMHRNGSSALVTLAAVTALLLPLGHGATYAAVRMLRRRRIVREPVLVIGAEEVGRGSCEARGPRRHGLQPVGFVDDVDPGAAPTPLLGDCAPLDRVIEQHAVRRVIVAFARRGTAISSGAAHRAAPAVDVYVVPRLHQSARRRHPPTSRCRGSRCNGCVPRPRRATWRANAPSTSDRRHGPGGDVTAAAAPRAGREAQRSGAGPVPPAARRSVRPDVRAAEVPQPPGERRRRRALVRRRLTPARPGSARGCAGSASTSCPSCGTSCAATCRSSGRGRNVPHFVEAFGAVVPELRRPAPPAGRDSPAGPRSTACAATPRSLTRARTTTTTSTTGRCSATCPSSSRPSPAVSRDGRRKPSA